MNSGERLIIIAPELPPAIGGLADYTARIVDQWPQVPHLSFLVPARGETNVRPFRDYPVGAICRERAALLHELPKKGGKVLLQYSAYGFDSLGYPRWLIRALIDWKETSQGRLVIMFHEIWAFWPIWNKNYCVQWLHRRDLRRLLQRADVVFTSTPSQAQHLRSLAPAVAVHILPVGSNIPRANNHGVERRSGSAVLFGLEGTRLRTLRRMRADLMALCAARKITRFITIGPEAGGTGENKERGILQELGLAAGFEQHGAVAENEVSAWLSQSEFGISAQDELSLMKSGSLMALAAHGVNVLSPYAGVGKSEPLCFFTSPAELLDGITKEELRLRAERLQQWQAETSDWRQIATQFGRVLELDLKGRDVPPA